MNKWRHYDHRTSSHSEWLDTLHSRMMVFLCLAYLSGLLLLVLCLLFIKGVGDGYFITHGLRGAFTNSKYFTMTAAIFFAACAMVLRKRFHLFAKECFIFLSYVTAVIAITLTLIIITNSFDVIQVRSIFNLAAPMIFVYTVINAISYRKFILAMKLSLLCSFIGYLFQLASRGISYQDILQSSFTDSSSPLESSAFAGVAIGFCFFFCYYRESKFYTILAFIFAITTFKRLAIIFAVLAFLSPIFLKRHSKTSVFIPIILIIAFSILLDIYMAILTPGDNLGEEFVSRLLNMNLDQFTMGRASFYDTLLSSNFHSFGVESSTAVLGHSLEMDLPRIAVELSPYMAFGFIAIYFAIAGRQTYLLFFMVFNSINLITSHSLDIVFKWIVVFSLCAFVKYCDMIDKSNVCSREIR